MSNKTQKDYFLEEGADAWFERNQHTLSQPNFVNVALLEALEKLPFHPQRILDIGCSSGEKLKLIQEKYQCACYGIEPSEKAVASGNSRTDCNLQLTVGTADVLPYDESFFDCVFIGGTLVWCARNTLFYIASEVNRVLKIGGAIIIGDFESRIFMRNAMKHSKEEIWSYKMEHEKMFTWHPQYIVTSKISYNPKGCYFTDDPNERRAMTTIIKVPEHTSMVTNPWDNPSGQ